jgi:hypothetical protein
MDINPLNVNKLQELFQPRQLPLPQYEFTQSGAAHVPQFTGTVRICTSLEPDGSHTLTTPTAFARKVDAKAAAAYEALKFLSARGWCVSGAAADAGASFSPSRAAAPQTSIAGRIPSAISLLPGGPLGAPASAFPPLSRSRKQPTVDSLDRVILLDVSDPRLPGPHFAPSPSDFIVGFSSSIGTVPPPPFPIVAAKGSVIDVTIIA